MRDGTRSNPSRGTEFVGANEDKDIIIFSVQLTMSMTGNLSRLIHTLLEVMTIHTLEYMVGALLFLRVIWSLRMVGMKIVFPAASFRRIDANYPPLSSLLLFSLPCLAPMLC